MEWDKLKVSQDLEVVKSATLQDSALMDLKMFRVEVLPRQSLTQKVQTGEFLVNQVYPESAYQELRFLALVQEKWDLIQELIKVHSERPEYRAHIQEFQELGLLEVIQDHKE